MIVAIHEGNLWGVFPTVDALVAGVKHVGYAVGKGQPKVEWVTISKGYATFDYNAGGRVVFKLHLLPDNIGTGAVVTSSGNLTMGAIP